jgi:hypothetical protein
MKASELLTKMAKYLLQSVNSLIYPSFPEIDKVYLIHPSEKCLIFIPWENIPQPNDPFFDTLTQQTAINEGK